MAMDYGSKSGGSTTMTEKAARGQKIVTQTGPYRSEAGDASKAFKGKSMEDTGVSRSISDGKVPRR